MQKYNISCVALSIGNDINKAPNELLNDYLFMFKAKMPMSYSKFCDFFKYAGTPLFSDNDDNGDWYLYDEGSDRLYEEFVYLNDFE